ncbi:hypothetical protein E2562_002733 [Oryza meyeriana var. granulata]|uniref:Uncharacterized protein n=1 Tax=Oryza meyeriana var. granulata TaxID=110450 RepID=A0A6G1BPN4_9ORYZ|nr:hypothetical protein E2562_002733 [Oryza meyeriana var. granulata]
MAWTKWKEQRHGRSPAAAVENASQRTEYARSSGDGERPAAAWTGQARGLATSGSRVLSTPMPMSYAIAALAAFLPSGRLLAEGSASSLSRFEDV